MGDPFAWILAAALCFNGLLNLRKPPFVAESFKRWGFPKHFNIFAGIWEITAAILLVSGTYRTAGAVVAALCLLTAVAMIARDRTWLKLEYPLVLLALSVAVFAVQ